MTDPDGTAHRSLYDPTPGDIQFRDADQVDEDGMMEVRMPIASSGEVRNEGDDPLTGRELRGMATQVNSKRLAVFPEHGNGDFVEYGKYSQFEKLGYWQNADLQREASDDGEDLLMATARMPDPEPMPKQTGDYRQALAILKEQAVRGVPISASIGWREDEDMPGGVDLMEASIVGIGADPRTSTEGGEQLVARKAVEAGADPAALVKSVREAVAPDAERPFGTPQAPNLWDDFDECVADVEDWDGVADPEAFCAWAQDQTEDRATDTVNGEEIDVTPPEAVVTAAELALEVKDGRYEDELGDCGTGDGAETAERVIEDRLSADYIADEVAAYLTSHEEDVDGITDPPSDWGEDEWLGTYNSDDPRCGPVQYALWGGTATGTGLEWAQGIANAVAEARDEDLPYPERDAADPEDTHDMTDDTDGTTEEEQDGERMTREDMEERLDEMRGMIEENTELTREIRERITDEEGEDDGDEDEDDEEEDEQSSDAPESEQSGDDADTEQDADPSALEERIAELESELEDAREGDLDVQSPQADAERDAGDDADTDAEPQAARSERDAILGVDQ